MNVILASDFPHSASDGLVARLRAASERPRIAWVPASTSEGDFAAARERLAALGFDPPECCDVDEDIDQVQLAYLHEFDVVCLGDGDPIRFRYNAIRAGLAGRVRQCVAAGRLILGTGAGAMLLTPNVAAWRLLSDTPDEVLSTRGRFDGMRLVAYEVMPHWNRLDAAVQQRVAAYAERLEDDLVALPDGAALWASDARAFAPVENLK